MLALIKSCLSMQLLNLLNALIIYFVIIPCKTNKSVQALYTVEPLNNGDLRISNFWHNFTVIERLSGKIVLP